MEPQEQNVPVPVTDTSAYLTTVASIATIIDITTTALSSIDGDGVELIGPEGNTISDGTLHDMVSNMTYHAINERAISYESIDGSSTNV